MQFLAKYELLNAFLRIFIAIWGSNVVNRALNLFVFYYNLISLCKSEKLHALGGCRDISFQVPSNLKMSSSFQFAGEVFAQCFNFGSKCDILSLVF